VGRDFFSDGSAFTLPTLWGMKAVPPLLSLVRNQGKPWCCADISLSAEPQTSVFTSDVQQRFAICRRRMSTEVCAFKYLVKRRLATGGL
jgi:hypothetical protein